MEITAAGGRATPEHGNATSFNWWIFTYLLTATHRFLYNIYMENEQAEQLMVKPKTSKIFTLGKVAFFASLVSILFLIVLITEIMYWGKWVDRFEVLGLYILYVLCVMASVAFALSVASFSRPFFLHSVKWRSWEFVYSLIATVMSVLLISLLLISAYFVTYLYNDAL